MAASRLTCPECAAVFKPVAPPAGRPVRCPKCRAVFQPSREDEDDFITAVAVEPGPPARPRQPAADWDGPPRVPPRSVTRPPDSKGGLLLALGLIGGGLALVLVCGGGLAALLAIGLFRSGAPDQAPVAKAVDQQPVPAPQKVADPAQPVPQQPAQQPVQQAPPQAAQQQAPPPIPAGPPVEAIKPADPAQQPAGATSLPVELLDELKAATVFIKVDAGAYHATGSGFLVRALGDGGYVVTNHHVITVSLDDEDDPGPRRPFLRRRFFPPNFGPPTITLVFSSGSPKEQSVKADIVADDDPDDLAVLQFRGLKDPPHPIDPRQQPRLVETMPVFMFGFPFGQLLDLNKGDPAITVGKGSVSSLRLDERGELSKVQIDGSLNPGNSGGPVLDAQGRLVGVARAIIPGAAIGLVIPAPKVTRLLAGQVPNFTVSSLKTDNGMTSVQVEANVLDPWQQLRSVAVYYLRGNMGAQPQANLTTQAGAQKADLRVNGSKAVTQLSLANQPDPGYSFQVAYVGGDGQTHLTQPLAYRLGAAAAAAVHPNPQAGGAGAPPKQPEKKVLTDEEVAEVLKQLQDPGPARQTALGRLSAALPPKERRPDVIKSLEPLLKDPNWPIHNAAAQALAVWGGKEDAPLLLPLASANAGDWVTWGAGLGALTNLGNRVNNAGERRADVVKVLEPLLQDTNGGRRNAAVKALAAWGGKEDVPLLIPMLKDGDVFVRGSVFDALARFKDERCAEAVAERLVPFDQRGNAAKVLRAIGPAAEKAVLKYITHQDVFVRLEVCNILKDIGTKQSVPDLQKCAAEGGLVGPAAQAALNAINGRG